MNKEKKFAIIAYLIVCIVWGSTYLAIRIGVTDMPFISFAGVRFAIAGIIILAFAWFRGWKFPSKREDYFSLALSGFLLLFISNGLVCWAEQWIDSGLTALILASVPLFMGLIEALFPKDYRLNWVGWAGLFVGFLGVIYLVSPHFSLEEKTLPAIIAVILSAFNWAIASIYLKRRTVSGSMMPNVGLQMITGGTAFLLVALFSGGISLKGATSAGIWSLLYLIFIGSIVAYTAFNYMIKVLPASKAGTYAYINPVVAVILGGVVLKEVISAENIIAAVVILTGVVMVQIAKNNPVSMKPVKTKR